MARIRAVKRGDHLEIETPRFRSEAEEAAWWSRNKDEVERLLTKYGTRVGEGLELEVEPRPAKAISIRIAESDLERARQQATRKGLGYQTYMRMILHEALAREERKRTRAS